MTTKVKLTIESFELELQSVAPPVKPAPVKPKAKRTAWRDFDFDELLHAIELGLTGAVAAARRRADGDESMLRCIKNARVARTAKKAEVRR